MLFRPPDSHKQSLAFLLELLDVAVLILRLFLGRNIWRCSCFQIQSILFSPLSFPVRESERQTERNRQREGETDGQTDRQKERETHTDTDRERERERELQTDRQTQTEGVCFCSLDLVRTQTNSKNLDSVRAQTKSISGFGESTNKKPPGALSRCRAATIGPLELAAIHAQQSERKKCIFSAQLKSYLFRRRLYTCVLRRCVASTVLLVPKPFGGR